MRKQLLVLPLADDYAPSPGELDNLVYLTLKYTVGWQMREADRAVIIGIVVERLQGLPQGPTGISIVVAEACEYAYDHLTGEDPEAKPDKLWKHIKPMIEGWYAKTTPESRAKTD